MIEKRTGGVRARKIDVALCALIFAVTCVLFLVSGVRQIADSSYSLLLSEGLIKHRSFTLDRFRIPRLEPYKQPWGYVSNGAEMYQVEIVGDHLYYFYPPGGAILSTGFVALLHLSGGTVAEPDGSYSLEREAQLEVRFAAVLMAGLAVVFFLTSRMLLPRVLSLVVALGGALGTQVWSTASRALWAHTWGVALLGVVILMLVADATKRRRLNPYSLATLLAWTYFVRPTFNVTILCVTIYVFAARRESFVRFAATGALWLAGFVGYSFYHFGTPLPGYYRLSAYMTPATFPMGLATNLFSPSRGLFVYVPISMFVFYLCARYRGAIDHTRLARLAAGAIVCHVLAVALFPVWWAGFSFGARFMTDVVPWLVLLAALGSRAMRAAGNREADRSSRRRLELAAGATLLALSVFINARGANVFATSRWNQLPVSVDAQPARVWDWRDPQFLRSAP